MVVYKSEYKQWRAMDAAQRAQLLMEYAEMCWVMLDMQNSRIMYWEHPSNHAVARSQMFMQRLEVDFFFMALNRLIQVADIVQDAADPNRVMPDARAAFDEATAGHVPDSLTDKPVTVTSVRNALEHLNPQNPDLDFIRAEHGWTVLYRDKRFYTLELFIAATDLWRAICPSLAGCRL